MKKVFLISLLLLLFNVMGSQAKNVKGNGQIVTKEIAPGEFHSLAIGYRGGVSFSGFFLMLFSNQSALGVCHYAHGEECGLKLTIDENLLDCISVSLQGEELCVGVKEGCGITPTAFELQITSKELKKLSVSAGMDFYLDTPLTGDSLKAVANGGSDIVMKQPVQVDYLTCESNGGSDIYFDNLTCNHIKGVANGGSDLHLSGTADEAHLNASGGSDVKAYGLKIKKATCRANGGSDVFVYAIETLHAEANGGSDVHYKGSAEVSMSAIGGSDVKKED